MGLTEAIHALIDEKASAIMSIVGKRYEKSEMNPKKLGERAAVFDNVGMTKEERRGAWKVE